MTVSVTPLVERMAGRPLAQRQSRSAAIDVDIEWTDMVEDAPAILKTIREPDQAMADAGDPAIWEAMNSDR